MSLQDRLIEEMKQAMRERKTLRLDVIRLLRARIKNVEIDQGELNDDQVQQIVQQQIKQWKEAIVDYKKGQRQDLVDEAEQKVAILQEYLPQQLTDAEIVEIIKKIVAETKLDQLGPVIGKVKQQIGNQADGSRIAMLVKEFFQ